MKRVLLLICSLSISILFVCTLYYLENRSVRENITKQGVLTLRGKNAIPKEMFQERTDIVEVVIEDGITEIGNSSFKGCSNLTKITIPETVYSIEMCAFQNCSSIPEVEIAANVSEIPAQCFNGCSSLQQATLNDGLQTISNYAFANCTSLSYVAIPASVTSIADSAFNNDPNLTLGVYYGSYAYDYAVAKGISYTLLDNVKLGDANGDGLVNVNDITTMQRGIAEMTTLEGIYLHAADIDGNGECSIDDATYVQMFLAEYELTYPIDEVMTQ